MIAVNVNLQREGSSTDVGMEGLPPSISPTHVGEFLLAVPQKEPKTRSLAESGWTALAD